MLPWGSRRSRTLLFSSISDDQVMEDLIACPWDQLDDFGNKVGGLPASVELDPVLLRRFR